jgi:hypothetical protein
MPPPRVCGVEAGLFGAQAGAEDSAFHAAFLEEAADVLFGFGVGGGGEADALGAGEGTVADDVALGAVDVPAQMPGLLR